MALCDFARREKWYKHNTLDAAAMYVGALLATYIAGRYVLQKAKDKYQMVADMSFIGAEQKCISRGS